MQHTTYFALTMRVQQGPTLSIVTRNLRHISTEDTPQAQGVFVPIFGEHCLSKPLT